MRKVLCQAIFISSMLCVLTAAHAADEAVWLATLAPEQTLHWQGTTSAAVPQRIQQGSVPLGSLSKLFAWIYLTGNGIPEQPYVCAASLPQPGEEYCCEPGQQIGRDLALARSCGAYFSPQRLGLQAAAWRRWWQAQAPRSPWLHELENQRPDFLLPVSAVLQALQQVPMRERELARSALLGRLMQPKWQEFLATAGSAYRFKTFTWNDPGRKGSVLGGSAGWLASGQPFWVGGEGLSYEVMQRVAGQLPELLPPPEKSHAGAAATGSCVDVSFFQHYPLKRVLDAEGQVVTHPGRLSGRFVAVFDNDRQLALDSNEQLTLSWQHHTPVITARFDLEEYVARVLDREADARETSAAQALAVAARSWLIQNARFERGCWQVADDTRAQRTSPNPPTPAAWRAAWFTEGLVLKGQPVFYHLSRSDDGRMSWQQAVEKSRNGQDFVQILSASFPRATVSSTGGEENCRRLPLAEEWLQRKLPKARELLSGEPGYEQTDAVLVCQLNYGNPYSDQRQQRIWIRRWRTLDDRVTLWHEYLHIAFRHHPSGWNENYLETMARRLAEMI